MKKFNIILFTLCIVLLLSGCSKPNFSSIEDLISPVTPSGDNADVQLALAETGGVFAPRLVRDGL